jgi:hypothetical protein
LWSNISQYALAGVPSSERCQGHEGVEQKVVLGRFFGGRRIDFIELKNSSSFP